MHHDIIILVTSTMKAVIRHNKPNSFILHQKLSTLLQQTLNTLTATGNYSAASNNIKLLHWPLMGGLLHLVQREGAWAGPLHLLAVPNVRANTTACVPITILLYNGLLLCAFNVPIKGLTYPIHVTTANDRYQLGRFARYPREKMMLNTQ